MNDYIYYNSNPRKHIEKDCVTRAISLATNTDYRTIKRMLRINSKYYLCDRLNVNCYKRIIEEIFKGKEIHLIKKYNVKEFQKEYSKGKFLLRLNGHLTCIIEGKLYDIFDCSNELVKRVWEII